MKEQKKSITILDWILLILGLVLAAGVMSLFRPCVHEDGSHGTCYWAGRMILGLGMAFLIQGLMHLIARSPRTKQGVALAMIPTALLTAAIPGRLVDLCMMADMRCNMIMKPAVTILGCAMALLALVDVLIQHRRGK